MDIMDIPMDIPVDIPFIMICWWDSMDMLMGYKGSRESQHWDFSKKNVENGWYGEGYNMWRYKTKHHGIKWDNTHI